MVVQRGYAPRFCAYQARVLLLNYRTMVDVAGIAPAAALSSSRFTVWCGPLTPTEHPKNLQPGLVRIITGPVAEGDALANSQPTEKVGKVVRRAGFAPAASEVEARCSAE